MNLLFFSGSLRKDSLNKKLLAVAEKIASQISGTQTEIADLQKLNFPVYDGDIEAQGIPENVKKLGSQIQKANGLIIASPEYNGSIASPLKNAIDWISRIKPTPLTGKPVLLLGASPGALGAIRGLGQSRAPFESLGCFLYPTPFGLPKADQAFNASGDLVDGATQEKIKKLIESYVQFTQKLK